MAGSFIVSKYSEILVEHNNILFANVQNKKQQKHL